MSEYIKREDVIEIVSDECQEFRGIFGRIERRIANFPSANVAECMNPNELMGAILIGFNAGLEAKTRDIVAVVRCKECKRRCTDDCPMCNECGRKAYPTSDDDFCSWGERKDDE